MIIMSKLLVPWRTDVTNDVNKLSVDSESLTRRVADLERKIRLVCNHDFQFVGVDVNRQGWNTIRYICKLCGALKERYLPDVSDEDKKAMLQLGMIKEEYLK